MLKYDTSDHTEFDVRLLRLIGSGIGGPVQLTEQLANPCRNQASSVGQHHPGGLITLFARTLGLPALFSWSKRALASLSC